MKKIALALALVTTSVFSATTFNTVKISDGKSAYCKSKNDIHRNKIGVYSAKAVSAKTDNQNINFNIELKFLSCVKQNDKFTFIYKKPYAEFSWETFTTKDQVVASASEVRLKAYKDGVYRLLNNTVIPDIAKQTQQINISLEDVLNQEQVEELSNGSKIKGSFDFWISKKVQYSIQAQDINFTNMRNFGSFRVHFEVTKTEKGLSIKLIK
ncbi:MAG: hypothetical protein ACJAT2_003428 [Bacteriovoracaceae bacterium]|jgi:hypothetical protein